MLDIIFSIYWITALVVGVVTAIPAVRNYRLETVPFIKKILNIQLVFWLIILNNFVTDLNWGRKFPYHELTRIAGMLGVCFLIIVIPRAINSWDKLRLLKSADLFFGVSGSALLLHYLITGGIYFATDYAKGLMYFDGHRVLPAFLSFILLALSHSYFVISVLSMKKSPDVPEKARYYLRLIGFGSIVAIPLILILDSLRWLIPFLWDPLPEERVFIAPAFYIFFNICITKFQKHFISKEMREGVVGPLNILRSIGLSEREAEVGVLLADGMAYKEIANKLFISLSTVQTHVKQIYKKTKTNSKMQLRDMLKRDTGPDIAEETLK